MSEPLDFAVFGSGALAALLSGLLAGTHKQRVLHVSEPYSQQRLPRLLSYPLPLATRPEGWALLARATAESLGLLTLLDARERVLPTDIRIVADLRGTDDALAHMRHMARAAGVRLRRDRFTRVPRLAGEMLLDGAGVESVAAADARLILSSEGSKVAFGGEIRPVRQVVFADDAAIEERLGQPCLPELLLEQPITATLTAPAQRLDSQLTRYPDRGVTLMQRPDLSILALVAGDADATARLASALPGPFPLRRTATSRFRRLVPRDGAPVLGPLGENGPFIVAGLGEVAAFLAPPLARLLVGAATPDEAGWFAAHAPGAPRAGVTDFIAAGDLLP